MSKKIIPFLTAIIFLGAISAGCSVLGSSASEVAKEYWTAIGAKDYDVAYDLLTEKSKQAMAGRIAKAMVEAGTKVTADEAYSALESNDDNVRLNFMEGARQSVMAGFELKEEDFGKGIEVLTSSRNGDITEVTIGIGKAQIPTRVTADKDGTLRVLMFDKATTPKKEKPEEEK